MRTLKLNEIYSMPMSRFEAKLKREGDKVVIYTRFRGESFWKKDSSQLSKEDASEVLSAMLWKS